MMFRYKKNGLKERRTRDSNLQNKDHSIQLYRYYALTHSATQSLEEYCMIIMNLFISTLIRAREIANLLFMN